jgi:hypothetical protein
MGYWIAALLLVAFGFIGALSIGPPFLLVGLAMLVLGPLRRWPGLHWPPLVGVLAFILGVVLVVPMYCTATAEVGQVSHAVCRSILGLSWSGTGLYNPPPEAFDLGLRVGIAGGIGAAILTFVSLTLRRHGEPPWPFG